MSVPAKTPKEIADAFRRRPASVLYPEAATLIEREICPFCRSPIGKFRDNRSRVEYGISGLCQGCQDATFGARLGPPEEEPPTAIPTDSPPPKDPDCLSCADVGFLTAASGLRVRCPACWPTRL